jgi:hypothetical protein
VEERLRPGATSTTTPRASDRARIFAVFAPLVSGRARLGTCHISKRHLEYHTSRDTP